MPLNKYGYLDLFTLYIKILPCLTRGIEIIGFLNKFD